MNSHLRDFTVIVLLILVAYLLEARLFNILPFRPDILFATLLTFSLVLSFERLLIALLFASFLLGWPLSSGMDLALFIGVPLFCFLMRNIICTFHWAVNVMIVVGGGISVAYLLSRFQLVFSHAEMFLVNVIFSMLIGIGVFLVLEAVGMHSVFSRRVSGMMRS